MVNKQEEFYLLKTISLTETTRLYTCMVIDLQELNNNIQELKTIGYIIYHTSICACMHEKPYTFCVNV